MTIRSEIVAILDPLFSGRVTADHEPRGGLSYPYANVYDHISENPALTGDRKALAWRRLIQVDVFQLLTAESSTLLDSVLGALDGARIGSMHLRVQGTTRVPEPKPDGPGIVHHAYTCSVARPRA